MVILSKNLRILIPLIFIIFVFILSVFIKFPIEVKHYKSFLLSFYGVTSAIVIGRFTSEKTGEGEIGRNPLSRIANTYFKEEGIRYYLCLGALFLFIVVLFTLLSIALLKELNELPNEGKNDFTGVLLYPSLILSLSPFAIWELILILDKFSVKNSPIKGIQEITLVFGFYSAYFLISNFYEIQLFLSKRIPFFWIIFTILIKPLKSILKLWVISPIILILSLLILFRFIGELEGSQKKDKNGKFDVCPFKGKIEELIYENALLRPIKESKEDIKEMKNPDYKKLLKIEKENHSRNGMKVFLEEGLKTKKNQPD